MKVTFLGAAHEVTGSMTLIEVGHMKGIVDCGMEQGKDIFVNQSLPVQPSELDFVLLTHAHIDHSGNLPLLYKNGYKGKVYTTSATCSLCEIILQDCAHIQEQEAEWKSRKAKRSGLPAIEPLYDLEDVSNTIKNLIPCDYNKEILINENVQIKFIDVGHLLGSASIEVLLTEGSDQRKITFSGDVGNINQPIICDPKQIDETDYLVIESTYGDRLHDVIKYDYVSSLAEVIQYTFDRGGNVLIPAFAVGRTQEMLYFIREIKERNLVKNHGDFPVYVDSPLANEATSIFLQCDTQYLDEETLAVMERGVNPISFTNLHTSISQEESKAINFDKTPKVIISASGMCDAGRIRHHLKHNLWRPECTVLFVGFQANGTLGRMLVEGVEKVKLFNEDIEVNAEIKQLPGTSGHADKNGLINWLMAIDQKPRLVFINHGEDEVCESFKNTLINEYGYNAYAPYSGTSYDLLEEKFIVETAGIPVTKGNFSKERTEKSNAEMEKLLRSIEELRSSAVELAGAPNKKLRAVTKDITSLTNKIQQYIDS